MGENTLQSRSGGQTVNSVDVNQYKTAMQVDLVPRNTSGAVEAESGSLGTAALSWKNLFLNGSIIQNGNALNLTNLLGEPHQILDGKKEVDGFPDFLEIIGGTVKGAIRAGGASPNLDMIINANAVSLTSDIDDGSSPVFPDLLTAPSSNNTAAINDINYADQEQTKTEGEFGDTEITIDTIGTEISGLDGTIQAFSHGANPEVFFALIDGTVLKNCTRGIAGTLKEELTNNDTITLLAANHIFLDVDLSTVFTTRTYPLYLQSDPSSPSVGDFYFDTKIKRWKRYNGVTFDLIEAVWLGTIILDSTESKFAVNSDFTLSWDNKLDREIKWVDSSTVNVIIKQVSVGGISHDIRSLSGTDYTIAGNLEPGRSEVANKNYYIYLQNDLTVFFSDIIPRDMDFKRGLYHPRRYWRCIGVVFRDGSGIQQFFTHGDNQSINGALKTLSASYVRKYFDECPIIAKSYGVTMTITTDPGTGASVEYNTRKNLGQILHVQVVSSSTASEDRSSTNMVLIENGTLSWRHQGTNVLSASVRMFQFYLQYK